MVFIMFLAAHSIYVDHQSCVRNNSLRVIGRASITASIADYDKKIPVEIGIEKAADQVRRAKLYLTRTDEHNLDCSIPVPDTH